MDDLTSMPLSSSEDIVPLRVVTVDRKKYAGLITNNDSIWLVYIKQLLMPAFSCIVSTRADETVANLIAAVSPLCMFLCVWRKDYHLIKAQSHIFSFV